MLVLSLHILDHSFKLPFLRLNQLNLLFLVYYFQLKTFFLMDKLIILILYILLFSLELGILPSEMIKLLSCLLVLLDLFLKLLIIEYKFSVEFVNRVLQGLNISSSSITFPFVLIALFVLQR